MKMVYSNESNFMANNVKNLIEAQGIKVFIKNEFSQGAIGEISAFDAWPEVWVFDDADLALAQQITKTAQHGDAGIDWVCQHCDEKNAPSFEICWHCQHENNSASHS